MVAAIEHPGIPLPAVEPRRGSKPAIKLVSCIIRSEKLDLVTEALNKLNLVGGMTVTEVRGVGSEKPTSELYRGAKFVMSFAPKVKVELAVAADDVTEVANVILNVAHTGEAGDGKIFIYTLTDMMRIRTSERGVSAL